MKAIKIAGGAALFLGVMAVTLVARTPLSSLQSNMPPMLQDTERFNGNLTRGSVKNLGKSNDSGSVHLQWKLHLLKLLTAKVGGDVEFNWLQASGHGEMAVSLGKTLYLNDTTVTSPASLIETFVPFVRLGGELRLELADGRARQDSYGPFTGELTWQQASVSITEQAKLGDITLSMSENSGNTHGVLTSKGGDIALKGIIELKPSGDYHVDIHARAQPSASRMIRNTLSKIAEPQSDGSFRIQQSGQLSELL